MRARIFQPARTAMSSGTAKTKGWVLEFAPDSAREVDPLMGWTSSSDTQSQVHLQFPTKEAALEYIQYVLSETGQTEIYTKNGGIPIRSDLFEGNPYLTPGHLVFANASAVGNVPFSVVYQELMNPWLEACQKIWAGEDIVATLDAGNAAMQRIIDIGN